MKPVSHSFPTQLFQLQLQRAAFLAAVGLSTAGCGALFISAQAKLDKATQATIPNPAAAPLGVPSVIVAPPPPAEKELELPSGTITDSAALASFTAEQVCFDVVLYGLSGPNVDYNSWDLARWQVAFDSTPHHLPAVISNTPAAPKRTTATVPWTYAVESGSTTKCKWQDCSGGEMITEPTYDYQTRPTPIEIIQGGGRICVDNHGIAADSTSMQMSMKYEAVGVESTQYHWRWNFTRGK